MNIAMAAVAGPVSANVRALRALLCKDCFTLVQSAPGCYVLPMVSPEPGAPAPSTGSRVPAPDLFTRGSSHRPGADATAPHVHQPRFILPSIIFFILCCFALPAIETYRRDLLDTCVGPVNVAAFSLLLIAWIIAALFVRAADIFQPDARAILEDTHRR